MNKTLLIIAFASALFLKVTAARAQEACKVSMSSLEGSYEGGCKKGKADGQGKATGTDQYLGEFKDGYPNGQGVYRWKNGDIYEGTWVKGKMEGKGTKSIKRNGKIDSVVTGFWKKDIYLGEYEKPYIVHSATQEITKVDIRRISNDKSNTIILNVSNTTAGIPSMSSGLPNKPAEISNMSIQKGSYMQIMGLNSGPKSTSSKLMDVTFPFKARLTIGNQEMVVEILQAGAWAINIFLNK